MATQYPIKKYTLAAGTDIEIDLKDTLTREYFIFGSPTLSGNRAIDAVLSADNPLLPGSSTPGFMWNGLKIIIHWRARPTLGSYNITLFGVRELTNREVGRDLRIEAIYHSDDGGWIVNVELISEDRTYFNVTYTEAAALVAASGLKPGSVYIISDTGMPNNTGEIQLEALTSNAFSKTGKYSFAKPSSGVVIYSGGGAGSSVDSVSVGAVTVTTGSEAWDTDLETTIGNVVTNIVANSGVSGFTAVSFMAGNTAVLVVSSVAESNADNTTSVSCVVTAGGSPLVVDGTLQMMGGLDLYDLWLNIDYDFSSDTIYQLSDKAGNVCKPKTLNSGEFKKIPWGLGDFKYNAFINCGTEVYIITSSATITNNKFSGTSRVALIDTGGDFSRNIIDCNNDKEILSVQQTGDVANNNFLQSGFVVTYSGGGDDVLNNRLKNVTLQILAGGIGFSDSILEGKSTWDELSLSASLSDTIIGVLGSTKVSQAAIAANAIDLSDNENVGSGIIEITNTGTLNTISNASSLSDIIVLRPAAGQTLTIDSATATNISIASAIPVALVGSNGDYALLRRDSAGTSYLVESFNNYKT